MAFKTILFAALFAVCILGAAWMPLLGVLGYVGHYSIGPERQWWHARMAGLGLRYSFLLAIVTAVGMTLNWGRLRFGRRFLSGQEKLLLLFLGLVWLSVFVGGETTGRYTTVDHPSVKFTKIVIFALMLTHVATDMKKLNWLLWVMIIGVLILGMQAHGTPRRAFQRGRLEGLGGPDFFEANYLAAYLAAMLPIIAVQFIRSGKWGKLLCMAAGAFAMNAIVLTRSRGAVVGIAMGGLVAAFLSPRKYRAKVIVGLLVIGLGGVYVADPQFTKRITTITRSEKERDRSAQSRFDIWWAGVEMIREHPEGVGVGNFYQRIGRYNRDVKGMAAHNTYLHCAADLGVQGIAVFGFLIISVLVALRQIRLRAENLPDEYRTQVVFLSYGMLVSLATLMACCMTISLTYTEYVWWIILLPVCLSRAVDNIEADQAADLVPASDGESRAVSARHAVPGARSGHLRSSIPVPHDVTQ